MAKRGTKYHQAGGHAGPGEPMTSGRARVNKVASTAEFRDKATQTKYANVQAGGMRGGWRL